MQKIFPSFRILLSLLLFGSTVSAVCEMSRANGPLDFEDLRRRTIAISVESYDGGKFKPAEHGLGSGFLIHPNGYVLTAKHILPDEVLKDQGRLSEYRLFGQIGDRASTSIPLRVVDIHPNHDAVLLQAVRDEPFRHFALSMEGLSQVVQLNAVGFPAGTDGKIRIVPASLRGELPEGSKTGEVNARLEGGFSGGPVLLDTAEVVGIIEKSSATAQRDTYDFVPIRLLREWLRAYMPPVTLLKPEGRRPRLVDNASKFEPKSLRYDLVIQTAPTDAAVLTQIRINTANTEGSFNCLSANGFGLRPLAEYMTPFHVSEKEVVVPVDPLFTPAGGFSRFGVNLQPDSLGACGPWSTDVTLNLIFDDGTVLLAPVVRLTSKMLDALPSYSPTEEEVLRALRDRGPPTRAAAVAAIAEMNFTRESRIRVLRAKLKDSTWQVRSQALSAIRKLALTELASDVAESLKLRVAELPDEPNVVTAEIAQAVDVLCRLDPVEGRDLVIDTCLNPNFPYRETESALGKLGGSDKQGTAELLIDALSKRHDWLTGQVAMEYLQTHEAVQLGCNSKPARYNATLKSLISGRGSRCKEFVESLLNSSDVAFDLHKVAILRHVSDLTARGVLSQDAFVVSLESHAQRLLNHKESLVRAAALRLYSQVSSEKNCAKTVRAGLVDPSEAVQIAAIEAAANRSLSTLKPDLEKMLSQISVPNRSGHLGTALRSSLKALDSEQ